jgi:hypothetical protein
MRAGRQPASLNTPWTGRKDLQPEGSDSQSEPPMMSVAHREPLPIPVDPHYSPQFYAELWGMSVSTVLRWFQDMEGVLKFSKPSKNGKRSRIELRIPFSLAMRVYRERTRAGLE